MLAECKQLGLEEENLMIKPRRRRRRHERASEICDQGKITTRERTSKEFGTVLSAVQAAVNKSKAAGKDN